MPPRRGRRIAHGASFSRTARGSIREACRGVCRSHHGRCCPSSTGRRWRCSLRCLHPHSRSGAHRDELLRSRFPHLARLPLDRNSWNTTPLLPTHAGRLRRAVARAAAPFTTRLQRAASRVERRYYHRVYDFNGPGWQKVRRLAEPHREHLSPWFRMDRLHAYVPPPDTRWTCRAPSPTHSDARC
jgi:hypothetical protein